MKIIKMVNQPRRDFRAIYECEDCGYKVERIGYDDRNFYDNVIPNIECRKCGKSSNTLGIKVERGEKVNDCFWYRIGTCDAGTCAGCETYLSINSGECKAIYAEYKKDMAEAIEPVRERYVEKMKEMGKRGRGVNDEYKG